MKLSIHQQYSRRGLMKVLGGAALALPCLELFERHVRANPAVGASKYAVFCYTPDGVNQGEFWPTGSSTNYTLGSILEPFTSYKDKLLIIGPQMSGNNPVADTGLKYLTRPPQHQAQVTLAARRGNLPYVDQHSANNTIDGPSIDQVIAQAVMGDSVFASLNLGMHPIGGDTPSDIHFREDGSPLTRLSSASETWDHVFGNLMPSEDLAGLAIARHDAVTDFLETRFGALKPHLSHTDQIALDTHLDAFHVYEQRVQHQLDAAQDLSMECSDPQLPEVDESPESIASGADSETLSPFFMDVISTAFACNLTKVASVTFGYPGGGSAGGIRVPWLGYTNPLHQLSHHNNNDSKLEMYAQTHRWIAGQIAGLMDQLAAIPSESGSGTVLDETTIYWFNRHGDGNSHSNYALPNVILGGTGGYFNMGRWLQLPATNPTEVLISIANAMGVEVPSFGAPQFEATTGLAALT